MRVFHSDDFPLPLPPGHRFPAEKYRLLRQAVAALPADLGAELTVAPRVDDADLRLVHDPDYIAAFTTGALSQKAMQRIGFPWSPELVERTLRSCGATVAAARAAVADGGAVHLAGGTHHARADAGAGYCVFHDLAVAARVLQRDGLARRLLVVDTDVHQGDGTAAIFRGDDTVFTFSIHGQNNFPGRKEPGDLDVALPDGTGDADYLAALAPALAAAFARGEPDCVLFLSGADPLREDRLGRLSLSLDGMAARDAMVLQACARARVPVAVTMGGGYAVPIERTVQAQLQTVRAALAYRPD